MRDARQQQGVALLIVMFFALMLSASIATFLKRATVDAILSRNRESMARAEALARGGIVLAKAVILGDKERDLATGESARLDTLQDNWARARDIVIYDLHGGELRLKIDDEGAKLNLNSLFPPGTDLQIPDATEPFLVAFLELMVEELPIDVQVLYEPRDLAQNLIDYVDPDDTRLAGGLEDDFYQGQTPPYRPANRALLSVDEIGLVEGFDSALVEALRPYVTVYPFVGGGGVNPNTAPPHILGLIFYNDGVDDRFAQEDDVRRILKTRENGQIFCEDQSHEACAPISEILPNAQSVHPPLTYFSETFTVRSEATVGNVERTVEAVVDRTQPGEPLLLSWKVW